jgi:hypothetical protein
MHTHRSAPLPTADANKARQGRLRPRQCVRSAPRPAAPSSSQSTGYPGCRAGYKARAPPHLHRRVEYPVCVAEDEGRGHAQPFQPRGEGGPRVHAFARVGAAGLREALPLGRPHGPQQAAQGPLACRWLHGDLERDKRRRWGGEREWGVGVG